MITLIKREIKELRHEITAIELTSSLNDLKITKYDDEQIMCIKAKIQVLNKVIVSYGVQKQCCLQQPIKVYKTATQSIWYIKFKRSMRKQSIRYKNNKVAYNSLE